MKEKLHEIWNHYYLFLFIYLFIYFFAASMQKLFCNGIKVLWVFFFRFFFFIILIFYLVQGGCNYFAFRMCLLCLIRILMLQYHSRAHSTCTRLYRRAFNRRDTVSTTTIKPKQAFLTDSMIRTKVISFC